MYIVAGTNRKQCLQVWKNLRKYRIYFKDVQVEISMGKQNGVQKTKYSSQIKSKKV